MVASPPEATGEPAGEPPEESQTEPDVKKAASEEVQKVELPTKTKSEPLMVEVPPDDRDALNQTNSTEQAIRPSASAETKEEDLALRRKSRQGSIFKPRTSIIRDDIHKKSISGG